MDFTNHLANFTRKSVKIINKFNQFRSFPVGFFKIIIIIIIVILIIIIIIIIIIMTRPRFLGFFISLRHTIVWNPFTCNGCYSVMAVAVMAVLRT